MVNDPNIDKFIGRGLTFPIQLDSYGKAIIQGGFDLLQSDLLCLMNWPMGTRFFLNEYGTRIEEFLETANDQLAKKELNYFIIEPVKNWEKRLIVKSVEVIDQSDTVIYIRINTIVNRTKLEKTFILPYYKVLNP